MKDFIQRIIFFLLILAIAIHVFVYVIQDSLLFFPTKNESFKASRFKHVEELSFEREGALLAGYMINAEKASNGIVFYFGGNSEDVSGTISDYYFIKDRMMVAFNYRAYGNSTGTPSQDQLFSDAYYIYKSILAKYPTEKVYIIGRSLGSGVACYVASREKNVKLCLVTPYDSILSLAKKNYPFLWIDLLLKHPFRSDLWVREVGKQITVIAALNDRVIPMEHTEKLIENMNEEPIFHKIKDADHNNLIYLKDYKNAIRRFLQD